MGESKSISSVFERFQMLKAMNFIVRSFNDERLYNEWIYIIEDQAGDEELLAAAEDEEIFEADCEQFREFFKEYDNDDLSFFIGGKVY